MTFNRNSLNPLAVWLAGGVSKSLTKKRDALIVKHEKINLRERMDCIDRMHEIMALNAKIAHVSTEAPTITNEVSE